MNAIKNSMRAEKRKAEETKGRSASKIEISHKKAVKV